MLREGGKPPRPVPASCDYLVVGGGATGMAFVDTLLHHHEGNPSVVMVDAHESPGGQWHDSYEFVRLHHPTARSLDGSLSTWTLGFSLGGDF